MAEKLQPGRIDAGLNAAALRFGIVVSRFNSFITERLLEGALEALERGGATGKDVDVVHVPGSFELPLAAKKLASTGRYDALISIGCILRGETAQAIDRAGLKGGNKGYEVGLGAIEMGQLSRKLRGAAKAPASGKGRRK